MSLGGPGRLLFIRTYITMLIMSVAAGALVLAGGSRRFSSDSLSGPRDFADPLPGEPWQAWGVAFLALGVLLLWAFGRQAAVWSLRGVSVIYVFFAVSLVKSVFDTPVASLIGGPLILAIALFHLYSADYLDSNGWG